MAERDDAAPVSTSDADHIARIDALSAAGRVTWFGLMAYLVFVFITLMGVEDADFFIPALQTQLPLINIAIPTEAFFYFAPVLGVALYVYLHLYVRKATGALTAAPPTVKGTPLERHLKPWLLNDLVLRWRGGPAVDERPLDGLSNATVIALIWVAGPFVLFGLWVRGWPAHNEAMTTLAALCLMLSVYVGHVSWVRLRRDIRGEHAAFKPRSDLPRLAVLALLVAGVVWLGWVKTESGRPWNKIGGQPATISGNVTVFLASLGNLRDLEWWGSLTPARLSGVQFSVLPPDQADPVAARQTYRSVWCSRAALPREICGALPDPGAATESVLWARRVAWCQQNTIADCAEYFAERDGNFRSEWQSLRARTIAALPKPDLRDADLRGADLSRASLVGVTLSGAQLDGANLRAAQMEQAVLTCEAAVADFDAAVGWSETQQACRENAASLTGANLAQVNLTDANLAFVDASDSLAREAVLTGVEFSYARIQNAQFASADFTGARGQFVSLDGTSFAVARFSGADLTGASMTGTDLQGARIEKADLSAADLRGASLFAVRARGTDMSSVNLMGAKLVSAQLQDADLWNADLTHAELRGADLSGAHLRKAQLIGTDMEGAWLSGADLRETHIVGADIRFMQASGTDWAGARITAAPLHGTDLRGVISLTQEQLSGLIGDRRTLLPERLSDGRVPWICSCWLTDPEGTETLLELAQRTNVSEADLRGRRFGFFCAAEQKPRKTGTGWPADTAAPWGTRSEGESAFDYSNRIENWATIQPPPFEPCPPAPWEGHAKDK